MKYCLYVKSMAKMRKLLAGYLKIMEELVCKHIMHQACNTCVSIRRFHVHFSHCDINSECSHLPQKSVDTWYMESSSMKVE
jgi:hypothetical protein